VFVLEQHGPALWARLNRPQAGNAIDPATIADLLGALERAERQADVRVLVIAASGKFFCTGADLSHVRTASSEATRGDAIQSFLADVSQLLDRFEHSAVPVVAAVQGPAVAGGLELALACDLVFAGHAAAFGDGHANYGLLPGGGGSVRLPMRVGPATARYLMFTGRTLPAAELVHTDLITRLVSDTDLDAEVQALAEEIATKSPLGVARMKSLVADGQELSAAEAIRHELAVVADHATSADFAEGLKAFAEKRVPEFTGR
jgi:enoyl-CoA hydratase/carnithine racemase